MSKSNYSATEYQSQIAISIFMIIFSLTIFVAIFFTDSSEGKIVNLMSGLFLLLVGGIFGYLGWRRMQESK